MSEIILFPFNGNAREAISVLEAINVVENKQKWKILGFVDDDKKTWEKNFSGYEVLGGREIFKKFSDAKILAVPGRDANFQFRGEWIKSLSLDNKRFATIIHPRAEIGVNCKIGYNSLINSGVVLTANVTISNHVVILPNSVIAHDSEIAECCMIGSNVSISGFVKVEKNVYVGTGVKIIQEVVVGKYALLGIGATIIKDIEEKAVVVGTPARKIRNLAFEYES